MQNPAFRFLSDILSLTPEPLYLVGGSVRDLLIGIPDPKDIDLVMPSGSDEVARAFAGRIGASFFLLDEERKISRVVRREGNETIQFDFTNFEGKDLEADLARRDFTINAMALDLRTYLRTRSLDGIIDLFGGREDIRRKLVRAAEPRVLDEDPLRLLRAARFAATLGFSIEDATADLIRSRADLITRPSPERVRDELFQLLAVTGAEAHLLLLESLGLLRNILPELGPLKGFAPGRYHDHDVFTHSLRTVGCVDGVLEDLGNVSPSHQGTVLSHLEEELEQFVSRKAALRFACLLHDNAKAETLSRDEEGDIHFFGHDAIGAERAEEICRRLRLSNESTALVSGLIRHHMRPLNLSVPGGPSKRALYRYCRDLKGAVPESVVLALADARATAEIMPEKGFTDTRKTAGAILEYYYTRFLKTEARPLLTGKDLISRGMQPGPRFRVILEEVRELQAEGGITTREEALAYLEHEERSRSGGGAGGGGE